MLPYQAVHPGGVGRAKRVMALVLGQRACAEPSGRRFRHPGPSSGGAGPRGVGMSCRKEAKRTSQNKCLL